MDVQYCIYIQPGGITESDYGTARRIEAESGCNCQRRVYIDHVLAGMATGETSSAGLVHGPEFSRMPSSTKRRGT